MKKIAVIILIHVFFQNTTGKTQDIHYSQFWNTQINLNPALTGIFPATYRFFANYRNQWKSVTVPFSTMTVGGDALQPMGLKNMGLGAVLNFDMAGDSRFKTFQFNASGSYIKKLDADSTHIISGGLMVGLTSRTISYDQLRFDEQFNGMAYDATIPVTETFQRENRLYPNFHIGIAYHKILGRRSHITAGISLNNITKPKQSYFNVNKITLDRKVNIHAEGAFPITEKLDLMPALIIQQQGKYNESIPGCNVRLRLIDEKGIYKAVSAGFWYRHKDAVYVYGGYEFMESWRFGLSYDINLSDLVPASNARGAIEFSVIHLLNVYKPKKVMHRICPDYM
ncbi:MAG: PorP/SprF family type IX secretion system membrane protein [Flavobacteriales bacterium]